MIERACPNRIPGYDLMAPCEQDLVCAIGRAVGPQQAEATWLDVCASIGVSRPGCPMTVDELAQAVQAMGRLHQDLDVAIRCFVIRMNSYSLLTKKTSC